MLAAPWPTYWPPRAHLPQVQTSHSSWSILGPAKASGIRWALMHRLDSPAPGTEEGGHVVRPSCLVREKSDWRPALNSHPLGKELQWIDPAVLVVPHLKV